MSTFAMPHMLSATRLANSGLNAHFCRSRAPFPALSPRRTPARAAGEARTELREPWPRTGDTKRPTRPPLEAEPPNQCLRPVHDHLGGVGGDRDVDRRLGPLP